MDIEYNSGKLETHLLRELLIDIASEYLTKNGFDLNDF